MPSLRILYDVEGWAYHHNARGLQRYAPPDFDVSLGPPLNETTVDAALGDSPVDLVLLFPNTRAGRVRDALRRRGWPTRLVTAISSGWPVRASGFFRAYELSDALVVANQEYHARAGGLPRTYPVPYGVDPEIFRICVPPVARRPRVLWTGALLQRRVKGYDELLRPLEQALRARGIDTDFHAVDSRRGRRRTPAEMAAWYNTGTVYVCASRAEGTPNPALEAAACGCTVVSTAVGNMPELIRNGVNGYLVPRRLDALIEGVLAALAEYPRLAARMQVDIQDWWWPRRAPAFYDAFREVHAPAADAPPPRAPHDSAPLAAVVARPGEGAIGRAREALLGGQDCPAVRCRRPCPPSGPGDCACDAEPPYCVWVDDEALPYRHAVRILAQELAAAGPDVAALVGTVFDVHLRCTTPGGLVIARQDALAAVPWPGGATDAVVERLEAAGHVVRQRSLAAEPLGLIGVRRTAREIYERAARAEMRARAELAGPGAALEAVADQVARVLDEQSELDLYALMGTISGALWRGRGPDPGAAPGFHEVTRYLEALDRWPGVEA